MDEKNPNAKNQKAKNLSDVLTLIARIEKSGALARRGNHVTRIIVFATLISRERRRMKLEKASLSRREEAFWLNNLMKSETFAEIRSWEELFGKSIYRMTKMEVTAALEEMSRDLLELLLKGSGRPKRPAGLICSRQTPAMRKNGGRPPKMTPKQERLWAAKVVGRQLGLFQDIQKIPGGFRDVINFLVRKPMCIDDVRQEVSDAKAIEDLEKCICENEGRPFDPLKLPALKARYSRVRRPLRTFVRKWGGLR